MSEIDLNQVFEAYCVGDPDYCSMIDGLAEAGVEWAGDVQEAAEALQIDAEIAEGAPLAEIDRGQLEALIVQGRSRSLKHELDALAEEGEAGAKLSYEILELCATDEQDWAKTELRRDNIAAEAMWGEELADRDWDPERFDLAFNAAAQDGKPEEAYARYVEGRLDPTPPKVNVEWTDEALGGEGNRHRVGPHSDGYDHAFASLAAENLNRQNGHPEQLRADAAEEGSRQGENAVTTAVLGSLADDWAEEGRVADARRNASIKRHAAEAASKPAVV